MRVTGRIWLFSAVIILALSGAGAYRVWGIMVLHNRPWHLEAILQARMAECRAGPGARHFSSEYDALTRQADAAGRCLDEMGGKWWPLRDYSVCRQQLLSLNLDVQLLRLRMIQRSEEQKAKLAALLGGLDVELSENPSRRRPWSGYELRSIEESRTRSLAQQARFLISRGDTESAMTAALRALASWHHFNHVNEQAFSRFEDSALRGRWRRDARDLVQWTRDSGRRAILVDKMNHSCYLVSRGEIEKSFPVNLGRNWHLPKLQEKDAGTPEGRYRITRKIAAGRYGMALLLDYPNQEDRQRFLEAKRQGIVSAGARIGGLIEIHGSGRPNSDWTDGCVALEDRHMRELYRLSYLGMPVTIVGATDWTAAGREGSGAAR